MPGPLWVADRQSEMPKPVQSLSLLSHVHLPIAL